MSPKDELTSRSASGLRDPGDARQGEEELLCFPSTRPEVHGQGQGTVLLLPPGSCSSREGSRLLLTPSSFSRPPKTPESCSNPDSAASWSREGAARCERTELPDAPVALLPPLLPLTHLPGLSLPSPAVPSCPHPILLQESNLMQKTTQTSHSRPFSCFLPPVNGIERLLTHLPTSPHVMSLTQLGVHQLGHRELPPSPEWIKWKSRKGSNRSAGQRS